jgi:hypothetical protein
MTTMKGEAVGKLLDPVYPWAPMAKTYAVVTMEDVTRVLRKAVYDERRRAGTLKRDGWDCERRAMETWVVAQRLWIARRRRGGAEALGILTAVLAGAVEGHVVNVALLGRGELFWFDSQFFDFGWEPGEPLRGCGIGKPDDTLLKVWG